MHQGLDLSKFKKVSSDKKTSTLVHGKGHKIVIAHSGLTPKMRQALEDLPIYAAEGADIEPLDDDSPAAADDSPNETPSSEDSEEVSDGTSAAPAESPTSTPTSEGAPDSGDMVDVIGQRPDMVPMPKPPAPPTAQEMAEEHQNFQQDLAQSKINPKTYNDYLWKDKTTPGKIGSIFGLLLSGMGSGLAHQPNMLMAMMDKTIDNDLNAQKSTQEGARNLYQLHLQHQLNRADIQNKYYQSALNASTANMKPAEKKLIQAQADQAHAMTKRAAAETAAINTKNAMLVGALHQLTGVVGNMPQGPGQAQAQGVLNNVVAPAVQQGIQNNIQNGAAKTGFIQALAPYPVIPGQGPQMPQDGQQGDQIPPVNAPVADYGKLNALQMGMPEMAGTVAEARKEAGQAQQTREMAAMYDNAFRNLNTLDAGQGFGEGLAQALDFLGPLAGPVAEAAAAKVNPDAAIAGALGGHALDPAFKGAADTLRRFQQWRAAQIGTLGPMIAHATVGRFSPQEAASQTDSLFPSLYDMGDENTRKSKYDNAMAWIRSQEITPNLDSLHAKLSPFPDYKYPAMKREKPPKRPAKKKDEAPEVMGPTPPLP